MSKKVYNSELSAVSIYHKFVSCTSMMEIFLSSTSQRCCIGLRSGDCGGYLSSHVQETSLRLFELEVTIRQFLSDRSVTSEFFCCYNTSASRLDVLCI